MSEDDNDIDLNSPQLLITGFDKNVERECHYWILNWKNPIFSK